MKNTPVIAVGLICVAAAVLAQGGPPKKDYPIRPVDFTRVQVTDTFWAPKMETNRTATIPFAMKLNEETGRVDNFRKAAKLMKGAFQGKRYNDSDVYKVMEGAAYSLLLHPDPGLRKQLDDLVGIIAAAQEPDGYLFTTRTIDPKNPAPGAGKERWSDLRQSHELYCAGHMYEAAVAHFLATGSRSFLDVALKNADLLVRTFGPGKRRGFPGHQEIEIGLSKLYRVTGERAYLELARFFLDERGRYFGGEKHGPGDPFAVYNSNEYLQNHKPVLEQDEAVGHAVRAMYMYAGMADVAALGGWPEYVAAIDRLWANVTGKKMYLTGGVGAREADEGFGADYELPNAGYAETCASVGNALWNHRLFLLHGDAKYVDVLERIMYNGLISGVSLDGTKFFYQNPLESAGGYGRSPWFEVACCPPNIARFLPSVPGYLYAQTEDTLYVNLFAAGTAKVDHRGDEGCRGHPENQLPLGGGGPDRGQSRLVRDLRAGRSHSRLGPERGGERGAVQVPRSERTAGQDLAEQQTRDPAHRKGLCPVQADVAERRRRHPLAPDARPARGRRREGPERRREGRPPAGADGLLRGGDGQRRGRPGARAPRRRQAPGVLPAGLPRRHHVHPGPGGGRGQGR